MTVNMPDRVKRERQWKTSDMSWLSSSNSTSNEPNRGISSLLPAAKEPQVRYVRKATDTKPLLK